MFQRNILARKVHHQDTVSARLSDLAGWLVRAGPDGVLNRNDLYCGEQSAGQVLRRKCVSREAVEARPRITDRIAEYLRDTRGELRKVSWPTRKQATNLTLIVLAVTIVMAAFLGAIDFLFATLVSLIVSL